MMRKFFLGLTLFFALESHAGDAGGLDDDTRDFLTGITLIPVIVVGALVVTSVFVIADNGSLETADFTNYNNNYYYDLEANAIIFTENTNLENFEILFSRDAEINFSSNKYFDNDLFESDELYVGFKYRF